MNQHGSNENPWIFSNVYGGAFRFDQQNRLTVRPINEDAEPVEYDDDDMVLDAPGSDFTRAAVESYPAHDDSLIVSRDEYTERFQVVRFEQAIQRFYDLPPVSIFAGSGPLRVEHPQVAKGSLYSHIARHARSYAIDGCEGWFCDVPFVVDGFAGFLPLRWAFDPADEDAETSFDLRDPINAAFHEAVRDLRLTAIRKRLTTEPERFTRMGWDRIWTLRDFIRQHAAV